MNNNEEQDNVMHRPETLIESFYNSNLKFEALPKPENRKKNRALNLLNPKRGVHLSGFHNGSMFFEMVKAFLEASLASVS